MEHSPNSPVHPSPVPEGYAEFAPPADLASWVECVWTRKMSSTGADAVHRVLPDGCVDMLFGFGRAGESGSDLSQASGIGTMTKPLFVHAPGPRLYVGARFRPGCAYAALGLPAAEITDGQIDYAVLSPDAAAELDAIAQGASDEDRVAAVVELVRGRMRLANAAPLSVRAAVRCIETAKGNVRVTVLVNQLGVTRQQLARQFATHVGVSPKTFARVVRARAVLARVDAARTAHPHVASVNWSTIALEMGYYDQAHLIDNVRELTGSTPGDWMREGGRR